MRVIGAHETDFSSRLQVCLGKNDQDDLGEQHVQDQKRRGWSPWNAEVLVWEQVVQGKARDVARELSTALWPCRGQCSPLGKGAFPGATSSWTKHDNRVRGKHREPGLYHKSSAFLRVD